MLSEQPTLIYLVAPTTQFVPPTTQFVPPTTQFVWGGNIFEIEILCKMNSPIQNVWWILFITIVYSVLYVPLKTNVWWSNLIQRRLRAEVKLI